MMRIEIDGVIYQSEIGGSWERTEPALGESEVDMILMELEGVRPDAHQFTLDAVAEAFPQMEVIESEPEDLEDSFIE